MPWATSRSLGEEGMEFSGMDVAWFWFVFFGCFLFFFFVLITKIWPFERICFLLFF